MTAVTPKPRPTHPLVVFSEGRHTTTDAMAAFWTETLGRAVTRQQIERWIAGLELLPHDLRSLMAVHTREPHRFLRELMAFEVAHSDVRRRANARGIRGPDVRDRRINPRETIADVEEAQRVLDRHATRVRWVPAKFKRSRLGAYVRFGGKSRYLTVTAKTPEMAVRALATKVQRAVGE